MTAVDSTDLAALEARLRAEFEVQVKELAVQVQALAGRIPPEGPDCRDTLTPGRSSHHLMREMLHAAPHGQDHFIQGETYTPMGFNFGSLSPRLEPDHVDHAFNFNGGTSSHNMLLRGSGEYQSAELLTAEMLEDHVFDYVDLPQDMWGVTIFSLTKDLAKTMKDGKNFGAHFTRFAYVMLCCALNLFLQIGILIYVNLYVVGDSIWQLQGDYAQYHTEVFDSDGNFQLDKWVTWDGPRDDLCSAVLTKPRFLSVILFLWSARMVGELKSISHLWDNINALPNLPSGAGTEHGVLKRHHQTDILGFTRLTRVAIYILVILPKLVICLVLWIIGSSWLTSTVEYEELILNALALQFVIDIDEQIFEYFLPTRAKKGVLKTKFAYPSKGEVSEDRHYQLLQRDYFRNFFFLMLTILWTYVYLGHIQWVLPFYPFDVGEHCGSWFENKFHPRCQPFETGCFPFGGTSSPHHYFGNKEQYGMVPARTSENLQGL